MASQVLRSFLDSRNAERLSLSLPVKYIFHLTESQVAGECHTINVSGNGVRLPISHTVSPATECQVTMTLPDHPAPVTLHGRVTWCELIGRSNYEHLNVGVAFAKPEMQEASTFSLYCRFIATALFTTHLLSRLS